jgi:hypothetical protein
MKTVAIYRCIEEKRTINFNETDTGYEVLLLETDTGNRRDVRTYLVREGKRAAAYRMAFEDFVKRTKQDRHRMFEVSRAEEFSFMVVSANERPIIEGFAAHWAEGKDVVGLIRVIEQEVRSTGDIDVDALISDPVYVSAVASLIKTHTYPEDTFCIAFFVR